jgi:hypothetical protein
MKQKRSQSKPDSFRINRATRRKIQSVYKDDPFVIELLRCFEGVVRERDSLHSLCNDQAKLLELFKKQILEREKSILVENDKETRNG